MEEPSILIPKINVSADNKPEEAPVETEKTMEEKINKIVPPKKNQKNGRRFF